MPRTAAQFEAMRQQSRTRILVAALELFARQGFERTSVREVAAAAGVAQGLLYNYFASKEELLRAIFEQCMADVRRSFAAAAAQPSDPLEALVQASFRVLRENLAFWRLSYSLRTQPAVLGGLETAISSWSDEVRATLASYFAAQGSAAPALDAALLFAAIDGVAQHYALDPEHYPLDAVADRLVARFSLR